MGVRGRPRFCCLLVFCIQGGAVIRRQLLLRWIGWTLSTKKFSRQAQEWSGLSLVCHAKILKGTASSKRSAGLLIQSVLLLKTRCSRFGVAVWPTYAQRHHWNKSVVKVPGGRVHISKDKGYYLIRGVVVDGAKHINPTVENVLTFCTIEPNFLVANAEWKIDTSGGYATVSTQHPDHSGWIKDFEGIQVKLGSLPEQE